MSTCYASSVLYCIDKKENCERHWFVLALRPEVSPLDIFSFKFHVLHILTSDKVSIYS